MRAMISFYSNYFYFCINKDREKLSKGSIKVSIEFQLWIMEFFFPSKAARLISSSR